MSKFLMENFIFCAVLEIDTLNLKLKYLWLLQLESHKKNVKYTLTHINSLNAAIVTIT